MRISTLAAAAAAAAVFAASASAQVADADFEAETVGSLAALCGVAADDPRAGLAMGVCLGWIEGAGQVYQEMVSDPRFDLDAVACPEGQLTREDVRATFVDWAGENPDAAGQPALLGMIRAVGAAHPCD